jgi:hypothetical protein
LEQIDGVIDVGNRLYLVEMKWTKDPIAANDMNAHLIRIYHRSQVHGTFLRFRFHTIGTGIGERGTGQKHVGGAF